MLQTARPLLDPYELLTIREAAALCHVDYTTFYQWIRKGVLQHKLVGPNNAIRLERHAVMALIRDGAHA